MHFETDCQQLMSFIKKEEEDWPALAVELDEINALKSNFNIISIFYLSRSLNFRADGLAKGVRSRDLRFPYVNGSAPRWLAFDASRMDVN